MSVMNRLSDVRLTLAHAFWIGVGCIAATLIVGFGFAGWQSAAKADQRVADAEQQSRRALAAAVCEKRLLSAADSGARLQKLAGMPWYERDELILEGGFATMPDRTEASEAVAMQCATRLEKRIEEAKAKPTPVSARN